MSRKQKNDPNNETQVEEISDNELESIAGGPNRRAHDHIGNFNFKVEIEGVTATSRKVMGSEAGKGEI